MNIKKFLFTAAAAAALAACSDYDPGLSEEAVNLTEAEEQLINEYTANFIDRYGQIDENHTWGFGEMGSVDEQGTRTSDPNSNIWLEYTKGKILDANNHEYDGIVSIKVKDGVVVPGFPVKNNYSNYNGKYHVMFPNNDPSTNKEHWFTYDEMITYMQQNQITEVIPLGDVTNPNTLSDAEVAAVKAEFDKQKLNYVSKSNINYDSYYVQQIWHGNAKHSGTDQNGQVVEVVGGDKVDYLCADGNDHFYNFNNSDFSNGTGGMMLIYDSNTNKFGYHNSYDATDYYDNFRLVELNGNYYVGFDFESNGADEKKVARDYIFNDWIVKIIPGNGGGTPIPNDEHWRIMCEDLGNTYDFDFNDLVYDVYYTGEEDNYTAHITLQAAGGTLPIYIGQKDEAHEVHRLFGFEPQANGSYLPVNVGTGKTADPKDITITGLEDTNPDNISIFVTTKTGGTEALNGNAITLLPPVSKSISNAPQKICIHDTTVKWTKESQQIEYAYPHFDAWVQAQDGEYKIDGTTPWYKIDVDKDGKFLFSK